MRKLSNRKKPNPQTWQKSMKKVKRILRWSQKKFIRKFRKKKNKLKAKKPRRKKRRKRKMTKKDQNPMILLWRRKRLKEKSKARTNKIKLKKITSPSSRGRNQSFLTMKKAIQEGMLPGRNVCFQDSNFHFLHQFEFKLFKTIVMSMIFCWWKSTKELGKFCIQFVEEPLSSLQNGFSKAKSVKGSSLKKNIILNVQKKKFWSNLWLRWKVDLKSSKEFDSICPTQLDSTSLTWK